MTYHSSQETAALIAGPVTSQARHTGEPSPASTGVTYPPQPGPRRPPPSPAPPGPRRPARPGQLALGISAAVLGQPLIGVLALTVSRLGPARSGPPAFGLAELLLLIGCVAGSRRARARGNRAFATGLLAGWAVTAALWLALCAVAFVAAMYSFAHSS